MKLKIICLIIVGLLVFSGILPSIPGKSATEKIHNLETSNNNLISDVPYVGQETEIQCYMASTCMVLNYLNINTSINELLYYSGAGHSLWYPAFFPGLKGERLPVFTPALGYTMKTRNLLAEIYGLNHEVWKKNSSIPQKQDWEKEWNDLWPWIKNKISNDTPIIIMVNEPPLLSDYFNYSLITKFLASFPITFVAHYIVITGYDENNNTVYYNDPAFNLFGRSDDGKYRSVDLSIFKSVVRDAALSQPYYYEAFVYENKTGPSLTLDEAFSKANTINIEKLKGNTSAYLDTNFDKSWNSDRLGINASIDMKKDFSKGINNRIKTFYRYKMNNRLGLYFRFKNFLSFFPESIISFLEFRPQMNDAFKYVAVEKNNTLNYLKTIEPLLVDQNNSVICNDQIRLIEKEIQNWTKLDNYYSQFKKKGIFMSLPRGIYLMNKMEETMDNIIAIEEEIILGPFNS